MHAGILTLKRKLMSAAAAVAMTHYSWVQRMGGRWCEVVGSRQPEEAAQTIIQCSCRERRWMRVSFWMVEVEAAGQATDAACGIVHEAVTYAGQSHDMIT